MSRVIHNKNKERDGTAIINTVREQRRKRLSVLDTEYQIECKYKEEFRTSSARKATPEEMADMLQKSDRYNGRVTDWQANIQNRRSR